MKFLEKIFGPRRIGPNDVLMHDHADRVTFFAYDDIVSVENAMVTLFASGIVHVNSELEECTSHITACEIIWRSGSDDENKNNLRVLKPKKD